MKVHRAREKWGLFKPVGRKERIRREFRIDFGVRYRRSTPGSSRPRSRPTMTERREHENSIALDVGQTIDLDQYLRLCGNEQEGSNLRDLSESDVAALIELARSRGHGGTESGLVELARSIAEPVFLHRLDNASDVDDALQDLSMIVLESVREPVDIRRFRGLVYWKARAIIKKMFRSRRKPPAVVADGANFTWKTVCSREFQKNFEEARAALPEKDRRLLDLTQEGLKPRHIAERLGVDVGALRTAIFRARSRFSKELKSRGIDPKDLMS